MSTETNTMTYAPGTFSWVDLNSPDTDASAKFYGTMFGWTHKQVSDPSMPYIMFFKDGKEVCGMAPLTADMKAQGAYPHWLSYVSVDNADAVVEKAATLGAKVLMPPTDPGKSGRMAVLMDPTGAAFGLWQPNQHQGAQYINAVGGFCWNELMTADTTAAATKFYTQLFPWTPSQQEMGEMGQYTVFMLNGKSSSGMLSWTMSPPNWLVYFVVENCDNATTRASELGARIVMPAKEIPNIGRFAIVKDPQGAYFAVMQMAAKQ